MLNEGALAKFKAECQGNFSPENIRRVLLRVGGGFELLPAPAQDRVIADILKQIERF